MFKVYCDICGAPAAIGLDASQYGVYVTAENLHMDNHHLCHGCADKIGLLEIIKAKQAKKSEQLDKKDPEK